MRVKEVSIEVVEKLKDVMPPKSGHQKRIERRKKERKLKK